MINLSYINQTTPTVLNFRIEFKNKNHNHIIELNCFLVQIIIIAVNFKSVIILFSILDKPITEFVKTIFCIWMHFCTISVCQKH